jgi:hypothetical protein
MAQHKDNNNPDDQRKENFGAGDSDTPQDFYDENDGMSYSYEEAAVTKIYVDGNEYNSVDEIPLHVREKMSETLLQMQEESSTPEDFSKAFKKPRRMRHPTVSFGGLGADLEPPPPMNLGKLGLISLAIVVILAILYFLIVG